jgi:SAM-dependent methyltransferase
VTVYDAAFSAATRGASSRSANAIVPFLIDAIEPTSVVDVGCGIGTWLAAFKRHGVTTVVGLDGPCVRPDELLISLDEFIATDLCKPFPIVRRFDLATSFEVAEHLPEAVATQFVSSLTKLAPVVAFSAAIPFQGGTGHVNEQWPSYWAAVFADHGYVALDVVRPLVWSNPDVEYWYAQNMLLFVDEARLAEDSGLRALAAMAPPNPLDIVHPTLYAQHELCMAPQLVSRVGDVRRSLVRVTRRRDSR